MPRVRLLPSLMVCLTVFFAAKLYDVAHGVQGLQAALSTPAVAEEKAKEGADEALAAESKKKEGAATDEKAAEEKAKASEHGDKPKDAHAKEEKAEPEFENPALTKDVEKAKKGMAKEFSQVEIDLLQNLSQRRAELEKWSEEIKLKENMLKATEERINSKVIDMRALKEELSRLVVGYKEEDNAKIKSLVKIYENMKPKDAARIFEQLDMPVLLLVADRMSERKIAPVLANMTPERAKELTIELAESQKVKPKMEGAVDQPLP